MAESNLQKDKDPQEGHPQKNRSINKSWIFFVGWFILRDLRGRDDKIFIIGNYRTRTPQIDMICLTQKEIARGLNGSSSIKKLKAVCKAYSKQWQHPRTTHRWAANFCFSAGILLLSCCSAGAQVARCTVRMEILQTEKWMAMMAQHHHCVAKSWFPRWIHKAGCGSGEPRGEIAGGLAFSAVRCHRKVIAQTCCLKTWLFTQLALRVCNFAIHAIFQVLGQT